MTEEHRSLKQIIDFRLEKLTKLRENGINPYPYSFKKTHSSESIKSSYDKLEGKTVIVAGRVMSLRKMGKASFCHIKDNEGTNSSICKA